MTAPGWYSEAYDPGDYKGADDYLGDLEEQIEKAREGC